MIGATSPIECSSDADSNTTAIGTQNSATAQNFFFDNTNRMTQFSVGSTFTIPYLNNARGQRVSKYLGSTATDTVYDESGHVLARC